MCVCVHARKAGKLSRESFAVARGKKDLFESENVYRANWSTGGFLIALVGAIINCSYRSASEDVHQEPLLDDQSSLVLRLTLAESSHALGMGGERGKCERTKNAEA